ncbi:uncharacterized protein V1510DRAFT_427714 [Dipodascopsis tothii]|uniref:uncharacterized protein n=1 Tax=Dipodascopsis tothii TaxID=44089 RepID=UPI0034CDCF55
MVLSADAILQRLSDPSADAKAKLVVATDLRDSLETYQTPQEYPRFLARFIPVLISVLENDQPSFLTVSPEHKLRNLLLEIIHRLPMNEHYKPYAVQVLLLLMGLLRIENEENGVLCMKIVTGLHRQYKNALDEHVRPFLDLVVEMYKNMPQVVRETFDAHSSAVPSMLNVSTPGNLSFQSPRPMSPSLPAEIGSETPARALPKSLYSFKVLTECPIIVVLLFSTHKQSVSENLPIFVPLIIEMLSLQAAPQAEAHAAASARGEIYTAVSPAIKNRAVFGEFITAQVKTMSFLAYVLRGFSAALKKYHNMIPDFVVRLLKDCPRELSASRKELLVATRHILSTDFRTIFVPKVDVLLNEKVLIGDGLTVHETLRPLAYSMVADLLHHVRAELTPAHIWMTVEVYSRNLQDNTLAASFQTMSAKLLLNLVERIMKLPNKVEGRQLIIFILDAFVEKFAALNRNYRNALKHSTESIEKKAEDPQVLVIRQEEKGDKAVEKTPTPEPEDNDLDEMDLRLAMPIKLHADPTADLMKDGRYLFKNLLNGLKTIMFGLKTCNPPPPSADINVQQWNETARGFNYEQICIFRKLFREGAAGFAYYASVKDKAPTESKGSYPESLGSNVTIGSSKEEKELLETFATVFIHIDPAAFHEVVGPELPRLFDAMFSNASLLHVPQFFLASEPTTSNFAFILLQFLMDHLEEIGQGDPMRANFLIRLFKLSFMAVNLFSSTNEEVFLPHLKDLILRSMSLATKAEDPLNYYILLRTLFRSIGGGRFEQLYKEVLPLLQVLLESLNKLLMTARKPQERDLYVELCLTVPVRLSVLVPHLNYLMRPLVISLTGSQELVSQGLRTLELCVDNLTPEYFDSVLEPVIEEVMEALWTHLKPLPYPHQPSHSTLRILGKLGGRNRRFITAPSNLKANGFSESEPKMMIEIHGLAGRRAFPVSAGLETAFQAINDHRVDMHYRVESFKYVANTLKLFIDAANLGPDAAQVIHSCVKAIETGVIPPDSNFSVQERSKSLTKLQQHNKLFEDLIKHLFASAAIVRVRQEALELIENICEHLVLLEIGKVVLDRKKSARPFALSDGEGPACLDIRVMCPAIADALSSAKAPVREAGRHAVHTIYKTTQTLFSTTDMAQSFPIFKLLAMTFCHSCYEEPWFKKSGGCLGIRILLKDLDFSAKWLAERQLDIIRALLFVLKDVPSEVPTASRDEAREFIRFILVKCNSELSQEDMQSRPFHQLTGILIYELSNSHEIVRTTVKESLHTLSSLTGLKLHELLSPVKQTLISPIFGKPLRALPFPMQIGNIDAITFCLSLENSFLQFNDELMRLLMEALALADADDDSLISPQRVAEHRVNEQLVQLRIVCIGLLTLAMTNPDFFQNHQAQQAHTRARIIGVFFSALNSKSKAVVDAANAGLKAVLSRQYKLPKDLLQNGLRPILMNLSDHKRLTVEGLDGLARLLDLLTNYFKVEIGNKLLDHLKAWAEPALLYQASGKLLTSQQNIRIIAEIMNVYHLLPPTAHKFMDSLVTTTIFLEEHLRRYQDSPFRPPLVKFSARYPSETVDYFVPKLADRRFGKLFIHLVGAKVNTELRGLVTGSLSNIMSRATEIQKPEEKCTAIVNLIYLFQAVAEHDREWLGTQREFLTVLLQNGKGLKAFARTRPLTSPLHLLVSQALRQLIRVFVWYYDAKPDDTEMVFRLMNSTACKEIETTPDIFAYIYTSIVKATAVDRRRLYLSKALEYFNQPQVAVATRCFIFQHVINAILVMEIHRHDNLNGLLEKSWIESVHAKIWRPALADMAEDSTEHKDQYRIQLLQMSAMLIHKSPVLVADVRKDIIKVGWNYIKLEDVISKQAASVLIAFFMVAYDTPLKIALQIYVQLLRAHHSDARVLVRQALDLLTPVLPRRLGPEGKPPLWSKYARRVIVEDGHNVSQVMNVYQFIVRHPDLFYDSRDEFFSLIVPAMSKLAFTANSPVENQVLSVDLAELILKWEKTRIGRMSLDEGASPSRKRPHAAIEDGAPAAEDDKPPIQVPFLSREATITYLIRFACHSPQKATEPGLTKRIVDILRELLGPGLWAEVNVKLTFFDRNLVQNSVTEATMVPFINSLQVIQVTLDQKADEWILLNLEQLQKLLDKSIHSDLDEIQESLQPVLARIFRAMAAVADDAEDATQQAVASFLSTITNVIQENLTASQALTSSVSLASCLIKYRPAAVDPLLPLLMKAFGKLCKDHIVAIAGPAAQPAGADAPAPLSEAEAKNVVKLLEKILEIAAERISHLEDQRRIFLQVVTQLVERSNDIGLSFKILEIVRTWIFTNPELFPLLKEKTSILSKMMLFEGRGDAKLTKAFYQLVVDIYEDTSLTRTELTVRMEHTFLVGTRVDDVPIRQRFMAIFSNSLDRSLWKRFLYVVKDQNWESLADSLWLNQALQLMFGAVDHKAPVALQPDDFRTPTFQYLTKTLPADAEYTTSEAVGDFIRRRQAFAAQVAEVTAGDILPPLVELFYHDAEAVRRAWIAMFPIAWGTVASRDRPDVTRNLVALLTKEYHSRQMDKRPNAIQIVLEGIGRCAQPVQLPPHLVKYLGKSYDGWYTAIELLEAAEHELGADNGPIKESTQDALVEMYASLQEDDMFYGSWRRRCQYTETNSALSYEQAGLWDLAQQTYETAQIKARSGALPYSESEYTLWEDHWILSAEKLQQWEILSELAKHEGFTDLLLECAWRMADWIAEKEPLEQSIKSLMDVPTPRRYIFDAFMCLQKLAQKIELAPELSKTCDEGIQLSLRKWSSLPRNFTNAHIPLLQTFQQFVELLEASQIYKSLSTTTAANLVTKSQELKVVLQAWRERLPNMWDDINAWSDLVAWRQHVFAVINKFYLPLVMSVQQPGNNSGANSFAYRGFHEIAWIINRFAHVARKHQMQDVCISQLTKIYTLPNIEIQEAFLKLREQAKCHYQNPNELRTGLEVISNTNLVYFGAQQKAEFFTLKGMFLAKLDMLEDANQAFATAVQIDLNLPKAWAEWGYYNDHRFKSEKDIVHAGHAISCYLQAAALYKNGKARKLLGRILWLISLDDSTNTLAHTFDNYRGEVPVWYWITYIPQLLTSLSHKEARLARKILIKIAKSYPQALHFHLRTTKEDYAVLQRQAMQAAQREASRNPGVRNSPSLQQAGTPSESPHLQQASLNATPSPRMPVNQPLQAGPAGQFANATPLQPWEYVDEITKILKTAYPLLALSMETFVDQVYQRFKCPADEDAYRLIVALFNDGVQYMGRLPYPKEDTRLPPATEANITRFADNVLPKHIKAAFEADFVTDKPNLHAYVNKLRKWRDRFEEKLDRRPASVNLEALSPHLSEFHYQKFEEVEIPGQYLLHKDSNAHFVKIDRFIPTVDTIRGFGVCYRRLTIRGSDAALYPFAIQYPAARHCRREERITQLFRILNNVLGRRKESRRRNLQFTLPTAIPLSPHVRIVQDDPKFISMHSIYEDYCKRTGRHKDDPLMYSIQKLRQVFDQKQGKPDILTDKIDILNTIQQTMVPNTVVRDYFANVFATFADFWLFRRQFAYEYAGITFMTYMMCIGNRYAHKLLISQGSGSAWATETLPSLPPHKTTPSFYNSEPVPFRLTPNIQTLIGPTAMEGLFGPAVMTIARCLTEPVFDLEQHLSLFVRDEIISWYTHQHRPCAQDQQLRELVKMNVEIILKKTSSLAQISQGSIPANQTVIDLISQAVNIKHLALTDNLWMPYL